MITITDADKIILENMPQYSSEEVSLEKACGRILREDINADRHFPPFNKSLMDGVAIDINSWEMGNRRFPIEGTQGAGTEQLELPHSDACMEVMTGAVIPKGANCVVPVEYIKDDGGLAIIEDSYPLELYKNIRLQGADYKKDDCLLKAGCQLFSPQISVCASIGKSKVSVAYRPKTAIISTGDEVVEINEAVKPYQIRQSNSYFMKAALDNTHLIESTRFHFPDNEDILKKEISNILDNFDILALTGGISMGKFDYIPQVLKELQCEVLFHKVTQKPGKPFWFGKSKTGKPIFALPGNPVATQVGMYRHVIKNVKKALGIEQKNEYACLTQSVQLDTPFTFFLMVTLHSNKDGVLEALPVLTGGSGDFSTVAQSDGFMEIPADTQNIPSGFIGQVYRW